MGDSNYGNIVKKKLHNFNTILYQSIDYLIYFLKSQGFFEKQKTMYLEGKYIFNSLILAQLSVGIFFYKLLHLCLI